MACVTKISAHVTTESSPGHLVSSLVSSPGHLVSSLVSSPGRLVSSLVSSPGRLVSSLVSSPGHLVSSLVSSPGRLVSSLVSSPGRLVSSLVSSPGRLVPGDMRQQTMDDGLSLTGVTHHSHISKLFCNESDTESIPNSQGSTSSQMFELLQAGSHSSNDSDEDCGGYQTCPDLSALVAKVTQHAPDRARFPTPRSTTPTKPILHTGSRLEITPQKSPGHVDLDPLTPTANLKMLMSAASPEIRHRDQLRQQARREEDRVNTGRHAGTVRTKGESRPESEGTREAEGTREPEVAAGSRKEKSLGLLCQRFLARYPKNPSPLEREEICLDEVAKDLMVERRRIYDIVNVLESVEMMSRVAKNRYTWHGRSALRDTLLNLKMIGEREGFAAQIDAIRRYEEGREVGSPRRKGPLMTNDDNNLQKNTAFKDYFRKDKSLGIMSQKFLMLFLVSKNKPINLDLAAKILIGDPSIDQTENAKFKTKIRRLYDIANILTSLDLIRKVHLTEVKGRKPAFKYIGPTMEENKLSPVDACQRPTSRHSLLEGVKVQQAGTSADPSSPLASDGSVPSLASQRLPLRKPLSRHSSFDQICEVAEQERNRLYFESNSQPSSPVKLKPKSKRALLQKTKSMPPVLEKTADQPSPVPSPLPAPLKHFVMIRSTKKNMRTEENQSDKNVAVTIQKLPIQNVLVSGKNNKSEACRKVLVKAQLLPQTKGDGQPRLVKVSKDQLDTVLKSLQHGKMPVGLSTTVAITSDPRSGSAPSTRPPPKIHMVRMTTQPQRGLSTPSMDHVAPTRKRPAKQALPEAGSDCYFDSKRPRTAESVSGSPPDHEVSQLSADKTRPSPRALHLDPQFQPSPPGQGETTPSPELPVATLPPGQEVLASPLVTRTVAMSPPEEGTLSTFRTSSSPSAHHVFHLPNTSSPVMLVPTPGNPHVLAIHPASGPMTPMTPMNGPMTPISTPVSTPVSFSTVGSTSSLLVSTPLGTSPKKLHLGASSIGALRGSGQRGPSLLHSHPVASPVPIHVSPVMTGLPVRHVQGIRPSSNAIINLIPHLTGGATTTAGDLKSLSHVSVNMSVSEPHGPGLHTVVTQRTSPVDHLVTSCSSVLLTPREDGQLLTPTYTPTYSTPTYTSTYPTLTPSGTPVPLTPSTYFRSTPGGVYQLASAPQVVTLGHTLSAFQPPRPSTVRPMPTAATARRLTLVEENL